MNKEAKINEILRRLEEIQEEAKVTQEKMARKIGVSVFTFNRWINSGLSKANISSVMLLTNFIEKYDEAKKSGKLDEFFPFP